MTIEERIKVFLTGRKPARASTILRHLSSSGVTVTAGMVEAALRRGPFRRTKGSRHEMWTLVDERDRRAYEDRQVDVAILRRMVDGVSIHRVEDFAVDFDVLDGCEDELVVAPIEVRVHARSLDQRTRVIGVLRSGERVTVEQMERVGRLAVELHKAMTGVLT